MSKNIYKCKNCNKPLTGKWQKTFCSSSCSATFNNKGRVHTKESKRKLSESLKKFNKSNPRKINPRKSNSTRWVSSTTWVKKIFCCVCGEAFWTKCSSIKREAFRKTCSDECYRSITIKNGIRTNRYKVFCRETNKSCYLDSSWEKEIAEYLDKMNIRWFRPEPIKWIDNTGKSHNYYADFYLPTHRLYIDPKNPYRMIQDKEKLSAVSKTHKILYGDIKYILERLTGIEPA